MFDSDPNYDAGAEELAERDFEDYCDFAFFREALARSLDAGRYATLTKLLGCDGRWTPPEVRELEHEVQEIRAAFRELPSDRIAGTCEPSSEDGARPKSFYDCFQNASGETCSKPFWNY